MKASRKALLSNMEKEEAKAIKYFSAVKAEEKAKRTEESEMCKQKTEAIKAIRAKEE